MVGMFPAVFSALSVPAISYRVTMDDSNLQSDTFLASLTMLPQDKGDESPACLDGSPYGFYFIPSTTGSTKWTIFIQGGGWCFNEEDCYERSKTILGSSEPWGRVGDTSALVAFNAQLCMNAFEDGTMDSDCNYIYMPYCDGASFSGYRPGAWPVPSNASHEVYFRGSKNFEATIDFAFEHGLDRATEFVLAGQSAGGLSTFLHADEVADRLAQEAPDCKLVRAAPIDGYFLEHDDVNGQDVYADQIRYLYNMQNMKAGGDLLPTCLEAYGDDKYRCFMSPHMQEFIRTPLFMFNSKYDTWQLANILQTTWTTAENQAMVLRYGEGWLEQFKPVEADPSNGAFVTSCLCHGCPWAQLVLEGKTAFQHYADWYCGKTSGGDSIHIDARRPNGDGTFDFQVPNSMQCFPFE